MAQGHPVLLQGEVLQCSKAFVSQFRTFPVEEYNYVPDEYQKSDYICWSNFLQCYIKGAEAIIIKGIGVTSKLLLGAYAESILEKWQKLNERVEKSRKKAKLKAITKSSIEDKYHEFINPS